MKKGDNNILNALTVDLEDWYQACVDESLPITERVIPNTERILNILWERGVKATFFVLGLVAEKFPFLIEKINREGHEIGSHGYSHRRVSEQNPEEFRKDVIRSLNILRKILNKDIYGYRAPDFSIRRNSLWALEILSGEGLSYDSSIFPVWYHRYGIPNAPRFPYLVSDDGKKKFYEFPLSTVRLLGINLPFAGGGWLRRQPFWLTRWGLRRINSVIRRPVMVYIHPYELDLSDEDDISGAPSWAISYRRKQNKGRATMEDKLRRLLDEFKFGPAKQVLETCYP